MFASFLLKTFYWYFVFLLIMCSMLSVQYSLFLIPLHRFFNFRNEYTSNQTTWNRPMSVNVLPFARCVHKIDAISLLNYKCLRFSLSISFFCLSMNVFKIEWLITVISSAEHTHQFTHFLILWSIAFNFCFVKFLCVASRACLRNNVC